MNFILDLLSSDEVDGVLRHLLTTTGGGLMAQGVVTSNQWTLISGGAVAVFGVLLSIANKKYMRKAAA